MQPTDLLSHDDALLSTPLDNVTWSPVLERMVSAVSQRIDEICGPVVARAAVEVHDGHGHPRLVLRNGPVYTVTTVEEFDGLGVVELDEETFGTQPADGYLVDEPLRMTLIRRRGGEDHHWPLRRQAVRITYQAGRFATTASVSPQFQDACGIILRKLWQRESPQWAQAASVFDAVDAVPTIGFYRCVDPVISEFLADQVRSFGFA